MTERDPNQTPPSPYQPPRQADDDAPTATGTPPREALVENGAAATPAERVQPPRRGSRARWGVALVVTALIVAVGVATVVLLTGQSAPSTVVGYAPRDSVAYGEIRLDLPGDQKQKLGQFLAKFPGFQDQSTLEVKIDDVLDRVVLAASDNRQDWSTKIRPWFGGEIGFSLGQLPAPNEPEQARGLVIVSVSDAARARAWFDELTVDLSKTTADHQGVPIVVFGEGGKAGAMAIHDGRTMLVGDEASVRAALDTAGRSDFVNADGPFKDALASISGEALGYVFFDVGRYAAWIEQAIQSMPEASGIPMGALSGDLLPDWLLLRAQARGDSLAFEGVLPHTEALSAATENRRGVLAEHAPPTTFVLLDGHEAGRSILKGVELAKQDPANAEVMRQIESAVAIFGGYDGLVGWMGDAGLALTRDGSSVTGGLLFQTADRTKADRLFATLKSFVQLGGASMGITLREEDHNGTPITIVDFGDWRDLAALLGTSGALPMDGPIPEGRLELAYAVTDDVVVIAIGPGFVRQALDAGPGPSLAEDARYRALIDGLGAEHTASGFVDLTASRELIETLASTDPEALAQYERDIKPYLLPLDAIVQVSVRDGAVDRNTLIVTVK